MFSDRITKIVTKLNQFPAAHLLLKHDRYLTPSFFKGHINAHSFVVSIYQGPFIDTVNSI